MKILICTLFLISVDAHYPTGQKGEFVKRWLQSIAVRDSLTSPGRGVLWYEFRRNQWTYCLPNTLHEYGVWLYDFCLGLNEADQLRPIAFCHMGQERKVIQQLSTTNTFQLTEEEQKHIPYFKEYTNKNDLVEQIYASLHPASSHSASCSGVHH